jgi:hypothetical protein
MYQFKFTSGLKKQGFRVYHFSIYQSLDVTIKYRRSDTDTDDYTDKDEQLYQPSNFEASLERTYSEDVFQYLFPSQFKIIRK